MEGVLNDWGTVLFFFDASGFILCLNSHQHIVSAVSFLHTVTLLISKAMKASLDQVQEIISLF